MLKLTVENEDGSGSVRVISLPDQKHPIEIEVRTEDDVAALCLHVGDALAIAEFIRRRVLGYGVIE